MNLCLTWSYNFWFKVDSGKVDGDRLCITGGSAGGYTTLAALAFRDTFKAGASLYGVSAKCPYGGFYTSLQLGEIVF